MRITAMNLKYSPRATLYPTRPNMREYAKISGKIELLRVSDSRH